MTNAPNDPIVFGESSLTLTLANGQPIEFADAVESAILNTPTAWADWNPISGKTLSKPVPSLNTLQINLAQDLTSGSLFHVLHANQRAAVDFVLKPYASDVAAVTGKAYIGRPGTFGGAAGSMATATAEFRLVGEPSFTWSNTEGGE